MEYTVTWANFESQLNNIDMFEDPVYESYVDKEQFLDIYIKVLRTLDGTDLSSYVDFYFQPSPINSSVYIFVDENAKLDFRDFAYEMGLVPEMKEIIESESKQEKINRNKKPVKIKVIKIKPKKLTKDDRVRMTIEKLSGKLEKESNPEIRKKLQDKLIRTQIHMPKV